MYVPFIVISTRLDSIGLPYLDHGIPFNVAGVLASAKMNRGGCLLISGRVKIQPELDLSTLFFTPCDMHVCTIKL